MNIGRFFKALRYWVTQRHGVLFAILSPDKKVLMQLRDQNSKRFKGFWCIPGGGMEKGEKPLDTVVREVMEEYGLMVKKENCFHIYSRYLGTNHVFVCIPEAGQTPVLNEGADMKWMSIEEIEKLELGFYQAEIIPTLKKYLSSI